MLINGTKHNKNLYLVRMYCGLLGCNASIILVVTSLAEKLTASIFGILYSSEGTRPQKKTIYIFAAVRISKYRLTTSSDRKKIEKQKINI
jgi:hypothetical protein